MTYVRKFTIQDLFGVLTHPETVTTRMIDCLVGPLGGELLRELLLSRGTGFRYSRDFPWRVRWPFPNELGPCHIRWFSPAKKCGSWRNRTNGTKAVEVNPNFGWLKSWMTNHRVLFPEKIPYHVRNPISPTWIFPILETKHYNGWFRWNDLLVAWPFVCLRWFLLLSCHGKYHHPSPPWKGKIPFAS